MKWMVLLLVVALAGVASPTFADLPGVPEDEDADTIGLPVGYSLTNAHQFGGSFVMGNRVWDRVSRREAQPLGQTVPLITHRFLPAESANQDSEANLSFP